MKRPYHEKELARARKRYGNKIAGWGPETHRRRLWEAQKGLCCFCEREMRILKIVSGYRIPRDCATVEHLQPRCYGGSNKIHNKALACHHCNTMRGHVCWIEFKSVMMGELHHMPLWKPKVLERVSNNEQIQS